jgi:D-glycero-alpha-D-manno-heptose-7-phosphate kinase
LHREVIARAPTRIDLGGGWTDVPPYCDREGGFVCSIAISRYAIARIIDGPETPVSMENPIVRAAVKRTGAAGTAIQLQNDFPVGAGLGGSSSASAAVLGGLAAWNGRDIDRVAIAEEGRRIEVEDLGIAGGRQDHYAATHGGALGLTFTSAVRVQRLALPASTRRELVASCSLIYTGESRVSAETITAVLGAYEAGEPRVLHALRSMRELAIDMADALAAGDLHALGELVGEHWDHQRSLHPSIPTQRIDDIVATARRAGALGAKAMGASGGGCVLVLSRAGKTDEVRHALRGFGELVDFDIDDAGLTVNRKDA